MHSSTLPIPTYSSRAATPTAPYSLRPPSPPSITIPIVPRHEGGSELYTVTPSPDNLGAIELTTEELDIVTRGEPQKAVDLAATWSYEQRREAQSILDYLYVGPTRVVRDQAYLEKNDISMIIVVRDARMGPGGLRSVDQACEASGIEPYYVSLQNLQDFIHRLPDFIRRLNVHMLRLHYERQPATTVPRRGRILITCDTGNDTSAALAAAYIMAVFGTTMHQAVQFISIQRFCCTFDEETKRMLQAWEDILAAGAAVVAGNRMTASQHSAPKQKRGHDAMMDADPNMPGGGMSDISDMERFSGRAAFAPFADVS